MSVPALKWVGILAAIAIVWTTAAGAGPPRAVCGWAARPPARWDHVIWIWMENESYSQVVGSPSAPYLSTLAGECGIATDYSAVSHPSLPNYIAATSGSTWGIADDGPPASHPVSRPSIFTQVRAEGSTWRSYEESMPSNCDLASSGAYAVKHNPAAYFTGIRAACTRWDVPLGTITSGPFASDLRRKRFPIFAFVTPNLCHDMHDCSVATGDAWLRRWVALIVASPEYRSGKTVLFITFDEGAGSNRVATVVVSPSTRAATRSSTSFDHYSLLKTTEALLGMSGRLVHAGDSSTHDMRTAFHL